jgi:hypothetical protein
VGCFQQTGSSDEKANFLLPDLSWNITKSGGEGFKQKREQMEMCLETIFKRLMILSGNILFPQNMNNYSYIRKGQV